MNVVEIGKFIAELRKEKGLTQDGLGEALGVTNKTVSRWETGTYMPNVEMLQMMGELFNVSINELLTGKRLAPEEYKACAEKNILEAVGKSESSFSIGETVAFRKRKWLQDHAGDIVLCAILSVLALFAFTRLVDGNFYVSLCFLPILFCVEFFYFKNKQNEYLRDSMKEQWTEYEEQQPLPDGKKRKAGVTGWTVGSMSVYTTIWSVYAVKMLLNGDTEDFGCAIALEVLCVSATVLFWILYLTKDKNRYQ